MTTLDLDEVLAIQESAAVDRFPRATFETELRTNPFARLWVLRSQSSRRLLGYSFVRFFLDDAFAFSMAVRSNLKGSGWGAFLLAASIQSLVELGVRRIVLTVRVPNRPARKLYNTFGFVPVQGGGAVLPQRPDLLYMVLDTRRVEMDEERDPSTVQDYETNKPGLSFRKG